MLLNEETGIIPSCVKTSSVDSQNMEFIWDMGEYSYI